MRLLILLVTLCAALIAHAAVVRPSPNFTWEGAGKRNSLREIRGQPVVLIIARSSRTGALNRQLRELEDMYQQFASRQVVFVAAIREGDPIVRSDIPFAIASNPEQIAAQFGVDGKFSIVIIGKDGNIDLQTDRVIPGSRVRAVIINSYEVQAPARKQQ